MKSKLWRDLLNFALWQQTGNVPCPSSYKKQFREEVPYKMLLNREILCVIFFFSKTTNKFILETK